MYLCRLEISQWSHIHQEMPSLSERWLVESPSVIIEGHVPDSLPKHQGFKVKLSLGNINFPSMIRCYYGCNLLFKVIFRFVLRIFHLYHICVCVCVCVCVIHQIYGCCTWRKIPLNPCCQLIVGFLFVIRCWINTGDRWAAQDWIRAHSSLGVWEHFRLLFMLVAGW